jgi:hypothetical protein
MRLINNSNIIIRVRLHEICGLGNAGLVFFTHQPEAFVGLEMDTPVGNVKWSIGEKVTYRTDNSGMVG